MTQCSQSARKQGPVEIMPQT